MRAALMLLWLVVGAVGAEHGVTARFVPEQVRPGEVFELRVEMERETIALTYLGGLIIPHTPIGSYR